MASPAPLTLLGVALAFTVHSTTAYNNGLGATPPMGWNTWCTDDLCGILDRCTEKEVKSIADAMASNGMKELGYEYVLLDDCWAYHTRDEDGKLQPNPTQFPSGIKALADYIHDKGLKFGLYTCVGTETCKKHRPGSYNHWEIDSQTFADWGVDYVKADNCYKPSNETERDLYGNFSVALNATGRPMFFATCEWGEDDVWEWGADVAQSFRVQADHIPFWRFPLKSAGVGYGQGVKDIIEWMAALVPSKWVKPYGWMDPDFVMTLFLEDHPIDGWIPMDYTASRTEFSFWSMWSSPLIMATDPRNMSEAKQSIIMNQEVIAIDQDPAFVGGDRIYNGTKGEQIWTKPLANGDYAVVLYNSEQHQQRTITFTWDMVGWSTDDTVALRDVWAHEAVEQTAQGEYTATIEPRDIAMLRITRSA